MVRLVTLILSLAVQPADAGDPAYSTLVASHIQRLATEGNDRYGDVHNAMWMSVVDVNTGRNPDERIVPARVYRRVGAPQGTTLYWDQPLVVAAFECSRLTGDPASRQFAQNYIDAYMASCIDEDGLFLWGNHQFYDAYADTVVRFSGGWHELRPITPAWELFWRTDAKATERYLRGMYPGHLYDAASGAFNRHNDQKKGDSFIEAGGILAETLAWLSMKTGDKGLAEQALRIAQFSWTRRGETTNLVINQPDNPRWDSKVSTTEVGVWAQSLLRAGTYSGNKAFEDMAAGAVTAYLRYGYDEAGQKYFGQLSVADGSSVTPAKKGYWPEQHSDIWNENRWPTHDYPLALAEACVMLYEARGGEVFLEGIRRWKGVIEREIPARGGEGTYAEHYGRAIHFLNHAGRLLKDDSYSRLAGALAEEAIGHLYRNGMFRSHPSRDRYESVDGVGMLCLSLLELEFGQPLETYGFGY